MGGFASGFRAGYGLVNDTYEGIRREQQDAAQAQFNQEKLAAEQARLRQDSRYNSERLRLQGDGNRQQAEFNKDKLAQDSQYNKDRLALLADGNRIAENEFQVKSVLQGAELASTLERNNAYGDYYRAEADKTDLATQTIKQRETIRSAITELQQTNTLSSGTLMNLRATGINPAKFLAPDAGSQLTNSWQFALGQRTDYDSADFTAAMNFLFEADTGVMRGQVPEGKGSPIMGQRIVGMEAVEGQEGAFRLVVQNQLLNGDVYNSYMTRGRKAGAEPAVLTMDQIGQQLEANTSAFEAFNRPDLMRSLIANYTQISPDVNNIATALRKQDLENSQTVLSNEEYQRAAIGMLFGSMEAFAPAPPSKEEQAPRNPSTSLAGQGFDSARMPEGNPGLYDQSPASASVQPAASPAQPMPQAQPSSGPITIDRIRRAAIEQNPGAEEIINRTPAEDLYRFWESGDIKL